MMMDNQSQHEQADGEYSPAAGEVTDATVVRTSAEGLDTSRQAITAGVDEAPLPAYVARPVGGANLPTVIVLPEIFGLHEHIADIARRFAHEGYLAVAVDPIAPHGNPDAFADADGIVTGLLHTIADATVMRDIDRAVAWAGSHGGDPDRVAVTGFCWGGRWAWLYAAHRQINAAVAWYGIIDGVASGAYPDATTFPRHPADLAQDLRTPILGLYGGQDPAIPLETITVLQDRLAERPGGVDADIVVFPEAGHAFFADYRQSYHPPSATEAWPLALKWMRQHGV
jgi:carboxymethylenebutenolidase